LQGLDKFALKIVCLYTAGLSGTWLSWFINQHSNFPQYPFHYICSNRSNTDVGCPGATWDFQQGDFQNYLASYDHQKEIVNTEYKKTCHKVLPDHDLSKSDHSILDNFTHVVFPFIDIKNSSWVEKYAQRNSVMWPNKKRDTLDFFENFSHDLFSSSYYDYFKNNKTYHLVNIADLLEGSHDEYLKLIKFIQEDPLPEWKDYAYEYQQTVFRNYL
jgi:hypothetical protein